MKRWISLFLAVLCAVLSSCAPQATGGAEETTAPVPTFTPPEEEVRGVWIASVLNLNFPSRPGLSAAELAAECDAIIENAKALSLNTIYFQVRPCGDALYESALFPTSSYLVGEQGAPLPMDVLDYMVTAAHKAGLTLHAWVNPVRVTSSRSTALSADNPATVHPEYTVDYADGKTYYDLGIPEVRELIADGVAEICKNYAVDGIVFDDYFYPYPVSDGDGGTAAFDDADTFAAYGAGKTLDDFRRDNVNRLVKQCYDTVKAIRRDCAFGISPFGICKNTAETRGMESYHAIYCDPHAWIDGGYVDYIAPQIYWPFDHAAAPFAPIADYWADAVSGTDVALLLSLGAYRYDEDTEMRGEITAQIEYARELAHYSGCILYGYATLLANTGGVAAEVAAVYGEEKDI